MMFLWKCIWFLTNSSLLGVISYMHRDCWEPFGHLYLCSVFLSAQKTKSRQGVGTEREQLFLAFSSLYLVRFTRKLVLHVLVVHRQSRNTWILESVGIYMNFKYIFRNIICTAILQSKWFISLQVDKQKVEGGLLRHIHGYSWKSMGSCHVPECRFHRPGTRTLYECIPEMLKWTWQNMELTEPFYFAGSGARFLISEWGHPSTLG
jgi:hypothetical protein